MERSDFQHRVAGSRISNHFRPRRHLPGLSTMKRVLVTGATGFIGRYSLAPLLDSGYEVHAVTSRGTVNSLYSISDPELLNALIPDLPYPCPTHWHQVDLLKCDSLSALMEEVQPTHLLHFA